MSRDFLPCSICIFLRLVDWPIHFYNKPMSGVVKINNKISNWLLTSEFDTIEFLTTQSIP